MKCYFLRRTEEWEGILENTDHPKVLGPDKRKVITNLFASCWESRTLNFSNKKHWLDLYCGVNQLQRCSSEVREHLEHNSNTMLVFLQMDPLFA